MLRRIVSLTTGLSVALVGVVVLPSTARADDEVPPPPTLSTDHVVEARDFATDAWADPWDFSSDDDLPLVEGVGYLGLDDVAIDDGLLEFEVADEGGFYPLTALLGFPHGRDGEATPVDGSTYRRLSMRIWSGADGPVVGRVWWFTDPSGLPQFAGTQVIHLTPGWQTVDIAPATDDANHTQPWIGNQIVRLGIQPEWSTNLRPFPVSVDWVRAYEPLPPSETISITVPAGANELWWDSDDDPDNNGTAGSPGRGAGIDYWLSGAEEETIEFYTSGLPPGTYRFFTVGEGGRSEYSEPLVVDARPAPVVLSPDLAGGEDWATVVRGDPWDMDQPTDIQGSNCSQITFSGGLLHGYDVGFQCGPEQNAVDVGIFLNTGGAVIDATIWRRLQYDLDYDGPFGLGFDAGGGTMSRVIWRTQNPGPLAHWHDSQDIVVVPGGRTITLDMHSDPRSAIEDESSSSGEKLGWGVPGRELVDSFRFDPHEDVGGRAWRLGGLRLARNDAGGDRFEITFEDRAWELGSTADIYAHKHGPLGQELIAEDLEMTEGVNAFEWNGRDLSGALMGPGTYDIEVRVTDPGGNTGVASSTGPVDMGSPFWDIRTSHPFAWEIGWFADEGFTTGFADGTFRAGGTLTRQAMAAFLYRQAGSPDGLDPACVTSPAWDVPTTHPFCGEITWMLNTGASTGFGDGSFKPDANVTRQAMAAFLYRQAGSPDGPDPVCASPPLWDVPTTHPFCAEIAWMLDAGVTTGFDDGSFRPGANLTRQAMAAFTYRLAY